MNNSVQLSDLISHLEDVKKKSNVETSARSTSTDSIPPKLTQPNPASTEKQTLQSTSAEQLKQSLHTRPRVEQNNPEPSAIEDKEEVSEQTEQQTAVPSLELSVIEKKWPQVVDAVKRKRIALGSLLVEGWPIRIQGIHLELAFASNNGFHINSVERQAAAVEEAIEEILGVRLKLKCVRIDKEKLASVRKMPGRVDKKAEFEKLEKEDNVVKEIVEKFDAEFIK